MTRPEPEPEPERLQGQPPPEWTPPPTHSDTLLELVSTLLHNFKSQPNILNGGYPQEEEGGVTKRTCFYRDGSRAKRGKPLLGSRGQGWAWRRRPRRDRQIIRQIQPGCPWGDFGGSLSALRHRNARPGETS
jgi:hypothetical protein